MTLLTFPAIQCIHSDSKPEVEIFYQTPELSREMCGMPALYKASHPEIVSTPENEFIANAGYVSLGTINTDADLESLFSLFQGENWSPNGEARDLIKSKGLTHTSMSVGDVVRTGDAYWLVDFIGFKRVQEFLS